MNPKPIDAGHAAEKLRESLINWIDQDYCDHQLALTVEEKITEALNALPALDYAPVVHAHWILCIYPDGCEHAALCSHCGMLGKSSNKYCPVCGAIMDSPVEYRYER